MKKKNVRNDKKLQLIYDYVKNVTELDIKESSRRREYVDARALFYVLAKKWTRRSNVDIGSFVDKDHATVIHSEKLFFNTIYKHDNFFKKAFDCFDQEMINHNIIEVIIEDANDIDFVAKNTKLMQENLKLEDRVKELSFEIKEYKEKMSGVELLGQYLEGLNDNQLQRLKDKVELMTKVMRQEKFQEEVKPKEMEGALL